MLMGCQYSNPQMIKCGLSWFQVALFCGQSKPQNVSLYLADFLNEYLELQERHILFNQKIFHITITFFICDAPARSFLKCIKQHNSYFSCERCCIKGTWNGRVVFNTRENIDLRTEEQFNAIAYNNHQIGRSPLIDYNIPCIRTFALDYMHLVCLGVMKRILNFIKSGPPECRLSSRHIKEISDNLLSFSGKMPSDFVRNPRSVLEMDRWKATEFRQFLLYTGPIALKQVLKPEMYNHV